MPASRLLRAFAVGMGVLCSGSVLALDVDARHAMMHAVAENWLASRQPDGLLAYGFDFLTDRPDADTSSGAYAAREAAAFWVWARYYRVVGDERYREPLRRGLDALATRSMPLGKPRVQALLDVLHVYDAPFGRLTLAQMLRRGGLLYSEQGEARVVSASGKYDDAWTGATALALLAELEYEKASGDQRFATLRTAWRDALLALYVPGRGFRESPVSIDDDDFATAEAWLALAAYADAYRDDARVRRALHDLDDVLIARFSWRPNTAGFQWSAMAAAQRFATTHDPRFADFARTQYAVLSKRFARRIDVDPFANRCASLEGFAALRAVLVADTDDSDGIVARIDEVLVREMARLPRLQLAPGQMQLRLGGDAHLVAPAMQRFAGAFLWDEYAPSTRIDAGAHCLSALLMVDAAAPP